MAVSIGAARSQWCRPVPPPGSHHLVSLSRNCEAADQPTGRRYAAAERISVTASIQLGSSEAIPSRSRYVVWAAIAV